MARREGEAGAAPGRKGLWLGILAYRWASFAWMAALAVLNLDDFRRTALAMTAIVVAGAWCALFTYARGWERGLLRWIDLGASVSLLLVAGIVMQEGAAAGGVGQLFFATAYPVSSAMTFGAAGGLRGGLLSGLALTVGVALSRPLNGVPLQELTSDQLIALGNGAVYYLGAGGAVGIVSLVLDRTEAEIRAANEEALRQRERAARLAERESLGRKIHDSVLQALAMVNKRGKELAADPPIASADVRALAEMAGEQERALRGLLQADPSEPPPGTVSLRTVLEASAFGVSGLPVTVTCVGTIWLPADQVDELSAAVRQALENAVRHSHGSKVAVFAERDQDGTLVSVRDDGAGFVFDEARLREEGRIGVLQSMRGRIEELGGTMQIHTAPGEGTEVEFRLPGDLPGQVSGAGRLTS